MTCPPECEFFPLGTKAQPLWMEVNQSWAGKSLQYIEDHLGKQPTADLLKAFMPPGAQGRAQMLGALFPAIHHGLLGHRDAQGKTLADQWEVAGWPGLNNDERVMMTFRRRSFATVIEVQRLINAESFECLDLLEPDSAPFMVFDRLSTQSVPRFSKLLGWVCRFPTFSRIGAIGFEIPDMFWNAWMERMREMLTEQQRGRPELTLKQMLAERMSEAGSILAALTAEAKRRMLESLDIYQCVAEFQFGSRLEEIKAIFESKPDFVSQTPESKPGFPTPQFQFDWVMQGESQQSETAPLLPESARTQGMESIGEVRVYPDRLFIEACSKQKYQLVRKLIDKYFGDLLHFQRENIVNLAEQVSQRERLWPDPTAGEESDGAGERATRARLTESEREAARAAHRQEYLKLLDQPVAQLMGATPRAAAQDPPARPQLIQWLKSHLHRLDLYNRREGLDLDIEWFLQELNVPELQLRKHG